jgi:hypothetical protein
MKMMLSGSIPKDLSAGGNILVDELIQIATPPFSIMADTIPAINPPEADISSDPLQKNSCIAPKGNEAFGKASFIHPSPQSNPNYLKESYTLAEVEVPFAIAE